MILCKMSRTYRTSPTYRNLQVIFFRVDSRVVLAAVFQCFQTNVAVGAADFQDSCRRLILVTRLSRHRHVNELAVKVGDG